MELHGLFFLGQESAFGSNLEGVSDGGDSQEASLEQGLVFVQATMELAHLPLGQVESLVVEANGDGGDIENGCVEALDIGAQTLFARVVLFEVRGLAEVIVGEGELLLDMLLLGRHPSVLLDGPSIVLQHKVRVVI